MSRMAFLTEAFVRAQAVPPSLSSCGWLSAPPEYFWMRLRFSIGISSLPPPEYSISITSRSVSPNGMRCSPRKRPTP